MTQALRKVIKRMHYPLEVMLTCVRWYAANPLSLRHIEEMTAERGLAVDHATVHRWAIKILPVLAAARRFLECAIDLHGMPEKITIDKSGANTAAIKSIETDLVRSQPLLLAGFSSGDETQQLLRLIALLLQHQLSAIRVRACRD